MTLNTVVDLEIKLSPQRRGGWVTPEEAYFLYSLVRMTRAFEVYECGTCDGWSAAWMALGLEHNGNIGKVYTFDIKKNPLVFEGSNLEHRIETRIGKFHELVPDVIENRKCKEDSHAIIFIDGAHGRDDVVNDFLAVQPYLRHDDHVIFHDTRRWWSFPDVKPVVRSIASHPRYEGMTFLSRNGLGVLRVKSKGGQWSA